MPDQPLCTAAIYNCSTSGASPQPDEPCRGWLCWRAPVGRDLDRDRRAGPVYETALSGWWACWPPVRPELVMTVARSVADVLTDHVVFEVECIDRMYLNVYVPGLQYEAGLVAYVHQQLGLPIASTAPLAKVSDAFSAAMRRFAG